MKPEPKNKKQAGKSSKAVPSLAAKKVSAREADQVKGGVRRSHDDEAPKEGW